MIQGIVTHVSDDSIEHEQMGSVYEIYIKPENTTLAYKGKVAHIETGMSLTAEIKVGERRIIEFFIYPLIRHLDEGMKVR